MISIDQSTLVSLKNYYSFTRQQLENLRNQVIFVLEEQSTQINMKALLDVLTNCEQSTNTSIQLLKYCQRNNQDKLYLLSQITSLQEQNQNLLTQNKGLNQTLEELQDFKRQSSIIINQIQQETNGKINQIQQVQCYNKLLEEQIRKESLYKIQLKYYENELEIKDKKINKLQLQISNVKKQLSLKDVQLQLAELVLQDLWKQKQDLMSKQNKIRETYSPSLNRSYEEMVSSKSSIYQIAKNKKSSLMQDLVESQISLPEFPFCSIINKQSIETVPQIYQSTQKSKDKFSELEFQSKISILSVRNQDKNYPLIFSKIMKFNSISFGVQTQDNSCIKRIHEWLRAKVVTQRIKI